MPCWPQRMAHLGRLFVALMATLWVILVGACGDGSPEEASSVTEAGLNRSRPSAQADTTPAATRSHAAQIVAASQSAEAETVLEILYLRAPDPCETLDVAEASESDQEVRISVAVRSIPQTDGRKCPDVLITAEATVEIENPLGGRRVVDASTGEEIPGSV